MNGWRCRSHAVGGHEGGEDGRHLKNSIGTKVKVNDMHLEHRLTKVRIRPTTNDAVNGALSAGQHLPPLANTDHTNVDRRLSTLGTLHPTRHAYSGDHKRFEPRTKQQRSHHLHKRPQTSHEGADLGQPATRPGLDKLRKSTVAGVDFSGALLCCGREGE